MYCVHRLEELVQPWKILGVISFYEAFISHGYLQSTFQKIKLNQTELN